VEHVLEIAERLAEEVLFPRALTTDRADVVPAELLDVLAEAGFYGLAGPSDAGGLGIDPAVAPAIVETLASGCLTTTFVWAQHHRSVLHAASGPAALRDEWLAALCTGSKRAGVAFAGLRRPDPPVLTARRTDGGWIFDGYAPWISGWGRIDVVDVAARDEDRIVWAFVDARKGDGLTVEPLTLAAVNASATVRATFHHYRVPDERVAAIQPFDEWRTQDERGLRMNGSFALGVTRRCCALLGRSLLDGELAAARRRLDEAGVDDMPHARAAASALAVRAASRLVISGGGSSLIVDSNAQRLMREAVFVLVMGQTASIRAAQLEGGWP
jgi:alkylation response protein AidB-like acyl-CoA dehydrogenase